MFTGLVRGTLSMIALDKRPGKLVLLRVSRPSHEASLGDSIAINGCCLTLIDKSKSEWCFELNHETMAITSFGGKIPGDRINWEPAMAASDRFDGHFVSGHVDGLGRVTSIQTGEGGLDLGIEIPQELANHCYRKGSIAIDGVSLTLNRVEGSVVVMTIIPHTLENTTINDYSVGSHVNVETDMIAKSIARQIELRESN